MSRFFTSDTHFSHARIIELSGRPFGSIEEMNAELIENWNRVVGKDDEVYHLGDLALGTIADSLPATSQLNGRKFLVPGNHDRVSTAYMHGKQIERFTPLYEAAGWTILPEVTEIDFDERAVRLCHFPYEGDSQENDRHVELRPADDGMPLIHGHIHEVRRIHGHMFNVGVDVNDFTPVHEDAVREWLSQLHIVAN